MKTHDALMAAIKAIETHSGDEEGDVPEWLQPVVETLTKITQHVTWGYSASTLDKFLAGGNHSLPVLIDMIMAEDDDDPGEADIESRDTFVPAPTTTAWVIEYYGIGSDEAVDASGEFWETREAAEKHAREFIAHERANGDGSRGEIDRFTVHEINPKEWEG